MFVTNIQVGGGGENTLYEMAREFEGLVLAPRGDVIAELKMNGGRWRQLLAPAEVRRATNPLWVPELLTRAVLGWLEIAWRIVRHSPEIVHVNNLAAGIYALPPAAALRKRRIWHIHDVVGERSWEARVVRRLSRLAQTIVVPSNASRDSLVVIGVSPHRIAVVPSGIDARRTFNPDTFPATQLREALGIPVQARVIAVVGHVTPSKGVHLIVDAMALLPEKVRHDLHLLVIGRTPPRWKEYESRLRERVRHDPMIRFVGHRRDIAQILRASDILVQASTYPESFGRSVAEAMAMCKVVVVSDAGALPSLVDDRKNGYIFSAGDTRELAATLLLAIEGLPESRAMTDAAREKALESFDWSVRNDLLRQIYRP